MFTPLAAADDRLRPWIALVVVAYEDGSSPLDLEPLRRGRLPVLEDRRRRRPAADRPDVGVGARAAEHRRRGGHRARPGLDELMAGNPGASLSRLLWPRRLHGGPPLRRVRGADVRGGPPGRPRPGARDARSRRPGGRASRCRCACRSTTTGSSSRRTPATSRRRCGACAAPTRRPPPGGCSTPPTRAPRGRGAEAAAAGRRAAAREAQDHPVRRAPRSQGFETLARTGQVVDGTGPASATPSSTCRSTAAATPA